MTMQLAKINPFEELDEIVRQDVPLARYTWNKIGGPARFFIQPRSIEQLRWAILRCAQEQIPYYVLGLGANLLVSDQGVDGAVFRLDDEYWRRLRTEGTSLRVSAGMDLQKLILHAVRHGLAGIECLAGIPATIGGAVRMNAGGKFGDIGTLVQRLTLMDHEGNVFERSRDELTFNYRHTDIDAPFVLDATLELHEEDPASLVKRMKEVWMYKRNSQPLNAKSAGCMFKNPQGVSAGSLIDQAGLKGLRIGGAEVSQKHANFIVAHPEAKARDVMDLISIIQEKVYKKNEIHLETEVQIWP
jgi:UDP-N-acetylmuramate dehydrogenase